MLAGKSRLKRDISILFTMTGSHTDHDQYKQACSLNIISKWKEMPRWFHLQFTFNATIKSPHAGGITMVSWIYQISIELNAIS